MNQMQAFIEKAKSDNALMAKLDELGATGAGEEAVVALAAEYGYNITVEDYQSACESAGMTKSGVLSEEDLDVVSGGGTENRWDPKVCNNYFRTHYNCVGFLGWTWCDHYERTQRESYSRSERYHHVCKMGSFDYIGYTHGNVK